MTAYDVAVIAADVVIVASVIGIAAVCVALWYRPPCSANLIDCEWDGDERKIS